MLTDNGEPNLGLFGPCPSPFATVGIVIIGGRDDPFAAVGVIANWVSATLRAIDANGDRQLCVVANFTAHTVVLVDNNGIGTLEL